MSTTLLDSSPERIEPAARGRQVFKIGERTALKLP
jgi:hypothetical protein